MEYKSQPISVLLYPSECFTPCEYDKQPTATLPGVFVHLHFF
jgi:hypothetical protein